MKQRKLCIFGQRKVFCWESWGPLRNLLKQNSQLEAFSCLELVLGGPSLPTAQVIQLIVGVEGDKAHLLYY